MEHDWHYPDTNTLPRLSNSTRPPGSTRSSNVTLIPPFQPQITRQTQLNRARIPHPKLNSILNTPNPRHILPLQITLSRSFEILNLMIYTTRSWMHGKDTTFEVPGDGDLGDCAFTLFSDGGEDGVFEEWDWGTGFHEAATCNAAFAVSTVGVAEGGVSGHGNADGAVEGDESVLL